MCPHASTVGNSNWSGCARSMAVAALWNWRGSIRSVHSWWRNGVLSGAPRERRPSLDGAASPPEPAFGGDSA
jgi:hypothetical protein